MDTVKGTLTVQGFVQSFEELKHPLLLLESEESWDQICKGLQQLRKLCQSGAFEHTVEVISSFRSIHRNLIASMNSERTRLSSAALDVLSVLAAGLGTEFDPLLSLFFPNLLSLCGRTNKVIISRAKSCIFAIIEATQLPGIINLLVQFCKDKSPTVRLVVAEGTLSCLKCFNPPDLEKDSSSLCIETLIRNSVRDANADIRKVGKDLFQSYQVLLPGRVENFTAPLTPTIRKYLQLATGNVASHNRLAPVVVQPRPVSTTTSQGSRAKLTLNSGLIRSSKNPSSISKPAPPTRSFEPLGTLQISAKREAGNSSAGPAPQKVLIMTSRSLGQDKNTTGPQRVIKTDKNSAGGPSVPSTDKNDVKSSASRLANPSRFRAVSSSSLTHPFGSQSAACSKKQMLIARKPSESLKLTGDIGASTRNLSRPTLSQLARVRPPVTKSITKITRGLEIRRAQPPTKSEPRNSAQGWSLNNKGCTTNVPAEPSKVVRTTAPALIPLPPSPDPSTSTPNLEPSDSTTLEESRPDSQPEIGVPADEQALSQVVVGGQIPALTPKGDGHVPDPNLALKTPISALLSSIQHGFDLTPSSPLSPPQDYLVSSDSPLEAGPFRLGVLR